jgi:hypothetical protein
MPDYTAGLIISELIRLGKDPAGSKVAVIGLAFKNNTGDLRHTPTRQAVAALEKACAEVALYDPRVDTDEADELFGIALSKSLADAVKNADCLAIFALHDEFRDIDFEVLQVKESCLVLDGRAYYSREKMAELRALGYHYRGVAAVVGVDQYLARSLDVIDINFSGTRNVLELAERAGARVVVAGTSEVFGKNPEVPWREDDDRVLGSTAADRWSYSSTDVRLRPPARPAGHDRTVLQRVRPSAAARFRREPLGPPGTQQPAAGGL